MNSLLGSEQFIELSAYGLGDTAAPEAWRPAVEELINGVWVRTWTGNYNFLTSDDAINEVKKDLGTPPTAVLHSNTSTYRIIAEQQAGTTPPVVNTTTGVPAVHASDGTLLTEGMLIKTATSGTVYVMQGGKKCPMTGSAFSERGYKSGLIMTVSQGAADSAPTGDTIYATGEASPAVPPLTPAVPPAQPTVPVPPQSKPYLQPVTATTQTPVTSNLTDVSNIAPASPLDNPVVQIGLVAGIGAAVVGVAWYLVKGRK